MSIIGASSLNKLPIDYESTFVLLNMAGKSKDDSTAMMYKLKDGTIIYNDNPDVITMFTQDIQLRLRHMLDYDVHM